MLKKIFVTSALVLCCMAAAEAQSSSKASFAGVKELAQAESPVPVIADNKTVESPAPAEDKKADLKKTEKADPKSSCAVASDADASACSGKCNTFNKIVFYVPNRIIDATDIVTFSVGVGSESSLYARATNYVQAGGAYGQKYYLTKGFHRQYGGAYMDSWNFGFLPFSKDFTFVDAAFGTVREYAYDHKTFSVPSYQNDIYTDKDADFWAFEVRGGWLVNAGVGVHPVEIADLLAGIFLIDLMDDDLPDSSWISVK